MLKTANVDKVFWENIPVAQVEVWGNGVFKIIRKREVKMQGKIPERGTIKTASKKSLKRLMALMQATEVSFRSMLTLTYPKHFPIDGAIVKADLKALLQKLRREKLTTYLWFLEFQKRGAPHIHLLLENEHITPYWRANFGLYWTERIALAEWYYTKIPIESYHNEVAKMARFNCNEETWQLLENPESAKRYVTKYAAKENQKVVPENFKNVGRLWGASRNVKPEIITLDHTEDEVRELVQRSGVDQANWENLPQFLWATPKREALKRLPERG